MAINEVIVTGRAERKLMDKSSKLWAKISRWTKACDVEFDDGKTAQTKLGAINGITSSLNSNDSSIALSASAGKNINDKLSITKSTLTAGATSINIWNNKINNNSVLSFYTSIYGVSPKTATVAAGVVTLTFDAQTTNMEVGVRVDG